MNGILQCSCKSMTCVKNSWNVDPFAVWGKRWQDNLRDPNSLCQNLIIAYVNIIKMNRDVMAPVSTVGRTTSIENIWCVGLVPLGLLYTKKMLSRVTMNPAVSLEMKKKKKGKKSSVRTHRLERDVAAASAWLKWKEKKKIKRTHSWWTEREPSQEPLAFIIIVASTSLHHPLLL